MSPRAQEKQDSVETAAPLAAVDEESVDEWVSSYFAGLDDGPVTVTNGAGESETFTVNGGKVSTTKAKRNWLLLHNGLGTVPGE